MNQTTASHVSGSKAALWTGRVLSGLVAAMFLMVAVMNLAKPASVVEGTTQIGFPEGVIQPLGVIVLLSTVLYVLRPTSLVGAALLTAYLGGAVATHVRMGDPLFTRTLVPVYFGVVLWVGLGLRMGTLRWMLTGQR
ncbi:MAG: DoxX family protein [Phycisphaerales bacterium]